MYFGKAIKLGGTALVEYSYLYFFGAEASCVFDVLEDGDELVFELAGCVIFEHFVGVGVLKKCLGLCWCNPLGP